MIKLRAFPRLHIGLLDLGHATPWQYGGAGFTICGPEIEIEAEHNVRKTEVVGIGVLDQDGQADVHQALQRLANVAHGTSVRLVLRDVPPQHVGLGSKTALLLGVLTAASRAMGIKIDRQNLQRLSGRGGTSGVGVHTFFQGGFIADGGHMSDIHNMFAPSSAHTPSEISPIISQATIPAEWRFHLILPRGARLFGAQEALFFQRQTPIPRSEAVEAIALMYHGIVPAVITGHLSLLKTSLSKFQYVGFKKRELLAQSRSTQAIVASFNAEPSCAAGLSSMGPLVYVVAPRDDSSIMRCVRKVCAEYDATLLGVYEGRNQGFEIGETTSQDEPVTHQHDSGHSYSFTSQPSAREQ